MRVWLSLSLIALQLCFTVDHPLFAEENQSCCDSGDRLQHLSRGRTGRSPSASKTPKQIALQADSQGELPPQTHLTAEPTAIVNGSVNVITGLYLDSGTDIAIPGAEPLTLQRNYISADTHKRGPLGKGWSRNHFGFLNRWRDRELRYSHHATVMDNFGSSTLYISRKKYHYFMESEVFEKGVTNCGQGMIAAQTNIKNNRFNYVKNSRVGHYTRANGDKLIFTPCKSSSEKYWDLRSETHLSGNRLAYHYWADDDELHSVVAKNRDGKELGCLCFETFWKNDEFKWRDSTVVKAPSGESVTYRFASYKGKKSERSDYLVAVEHSDGRCVKYAYETGLEGANSVKLTRKSFPNNRFSEIAYYRRKYNNVGDYDVYIKHKKDPRLDRVMCQSAPVGVDAKPIITHRYFYDIDTFCIPRRRGLYHDRGSAAVLDAHNHKTIYRWNANFRLKVVERYRGRESDSYQLYSSERLYWGEPERCDDHCGLCNCGNLLAHSFEDSSGRLLFARSFTYDLKGNVLCDKLYGNLTGNCSAECSIASDGTVSGNGCEEYSKRYTYSDDDLNLMTSSSEGSCKEFYFYKEGSSLLTKKLYVDGQGVYKREFYSYDNNGVVIREIVDDGSAESSGDLTGVSERHIKYIKRTTAFPAGLPLEVTEKYIDIASGKECLLGRHLNSYSSRGELLQREVYGSDDILAYVLSWEYDGRGNVVAESDAMGNVTKRRFDLNGNKCYERHPNIGGYERYTYDYANRLIATTYYFDDGIVTVESNKYNHLSQKTSTIDIFGHKTLYHYDDFGRIVRVTSAAVADVDGAIVRGIETSHYDAMGFVSSKCNGRGFVTKSNYNVRGSPTKVTYANGSSEEWSYNKNGTLKRQQHKNHSSTLYSYDSQRRVTATTTFSASGDRLYKTSKKYSTFHLIEEIDSKGGVKRYKYDGAGRVIEERKGSSHTAYAYDALGRCNYTAQYDGMGGGIVTKREFDLLGRLLAEQTEDLEGELLTLIEHCYDSRGNCISTTRHSADGPITCYTAFDVRNVPIEEVDGEGHLTRHITRFDYHNEHGQNVAYSALIDPLGNSVITIKDPLGRDATVIRKNDLGIVQQRKDFYYDAVGNKVCQIDKVINGGGVTGEQLTSWSYNSVNALVTLSEAVNTPEQKVTHIAYNSSGQRGAVTKPDGVIIKSSYDPSGRLSRYSASDGSFNYTYRYDVNDNVVSCSDPKGGETVLSYDRDGNIIEEKLANGLSMRYCYDAMRRVRKLIFPDGSGVEYCYHGSELKEVRRLSSDGVSPRYTHYYREYSLDNQLHSSQLIGGVGNVTYRRDGNGRIVTIECCNLDGKPLWSEQIGAYDAVGNILSLLVSDGIGKTESSYRYDDSYQLIGERGIADHEYSCDSLQNRCSKDSLDHEINGLNQLLNDGESSYSYDRNGNLLSKSALKCRSAGLNGEAATGCYYKYDALNRLVEVYDTAVSHRFRYSYDAMHRRLDKIVERFDNESGEWEERERYRYLYAGENEIGCYNSSGELIELRILGSGKGAEIGAAIAIELHGEFYAPIHDHNGNVAALIDAKSGQFERIYRYSAFGQAEVYDSGNVLIKDDHYNPWRFASKRYDSESGLIYFGRRYYDSETGRWTTPDPLGLQGGANLYAYVLHNPLTHSDLYGLFAVGPAAGNNPCQYSYPFVTACQFGFALARSVVHFAASSIGTIVHHFMPVPYVRDALLLPCHLLQGKRLSQYEWSFKGYSCYGDLGRPERSGKRVGMINGILNSLEEVKANAVKLSDEYGGHNVHWFYNASKGLLFDLLECACQKIGLRTHSELVMAKGLREISDELGIKKEGDIIPGVRMEFYSFSQGGLIMSNMQQYLSKNQRRHLYVNTFGSAKMITTGIFAYAQNYVSRRDPIPALASPFDGRYSKSSHRDNIYYLPTVGNPHFDHFWNGDTYQTAVKEVVGEFLKWN